MASSVRDHPNPVSDDLQTTISLLGDLAAQAEATLRSIFAFFPSPSDGSFLQVSGFSSDHPSSNADFCPCPYDSRHRMPPESLFRHSLRCPSAPGGPLVDLGFLEGLRYPGSLKSEEELLAENPFVRPLLEPSAELCFSLDKELEGVECSSFFYKDCPGVVTYPEADVSARTFTLPGFLALECANFACSRGEGKIGVSGKKFVILPSDFWALKREVEGWKEYPEMYSYSIAWVATHVGHAGACDLGKWIISTSPQFGIVIDAAMKDHIFLLLKLCLNAISQEASSSVRASGCGGSDLGSFLFKCPCLFQALSWLTSQLSLLYGEANSKAFAIGMVAECLLHVGSRLLLFSLPEYDKGDAGSRQDTSEFKLDADVADTHAKAAASGGTEYPNGSEKNSSYQVYISQIATAVAALRERSILEDRVRQLRFPQLLSKHQLVTECSNVSRRATEVRARRADYRPIVENDGLLWHKPHNQETSMTKSKEELLAEARDYKRRRMSYRGKKVKRTTTQVIRDIIEEHMEEIKQSGGLGYNINTSNNEVPISETSFHASINIDGNMVKDEELERSRISSRDSFLHKKHADGDVMACVAEDLHRKTAYRTYPYSDRVVQKQKHMDEIQGSERNVYTGENMDLAYGRTSSYRSYRSLNKTHAHHREQNGKEVSWNRRNKRNSYDHGCSSLSSTSTSKDRYGHASERRDGNTRRNHVSKTEIAFEDRYDPYNSFNAPGDDIPRKKCSLTTDVDGYDGLQR